MTLTVDIDRVSIALHGVSRGMAEVALAGLEAELHRRLGEVSPRVFASGDLGLVHLGPIHADGALDAAALRGLIAERLVLALTRVPAPDSEGER